MKQQQQVSNQQPQPLPMTEQQQQRLPLAEEHQEQVFYDVEGSFS
jgi:hypothetical protein